MVAFHDGTMSPLKWGTITKPGMCLRPQPQTVTEHMMQLGEQMSIGN